MRVSIKTLIESDDRLRPDSARYLRKYLGLTQLELSKRVGVSRKTVNQWESSALISPQHDFILRTLVYAELAGVRYLSRVRTALPTPTP
jgi:transcriptional regulator with XRE-family HTH domain